MAPYEDAIQDLTRSLCRNHERGIAYLARGLAYGELDREKDAALDFNSAAAFSSAEVDSFLKIFARHQGMRNRTLAMLRRDSAPWRTLLSKKEADRIRKLFA